MKKSSERFKHFEYKITGNDRDIDERDNITEEIRAILKKTFEKTQQKKNGVIKELNELIEKYPDIPQFKNHLFISYAQSGNMKMAHQVNELTLKQHPDYLFAKLNLAGQYLLKEEYKKIPEVLGPLMEIKALYPNRDIFHLNEVVSFYKIAIHYFLAIENIEAAETRLEILENLPRDLTTDIRDLSHRVLRAKMTNSLGKMQGRKNAQSKRSITKFVIAPTTEPPVFHHTEVEKLYRHDLRIDHKILQEILALPKETLLSDLHKIIYDSIARFESIANADLEEEKSSFALHALFLMAEIGDESSLPVMLDMLRQKPEYLEFYFGDHITETFWEIILKLGIQQTDLLERFILEGNYYEFARSAVTSAMKQIALHFPDKKEVIINWYKSTFQFFLENKDNNSLIDTGFISSMVSDMVDLRVSSLESLIVELYREKLIEEYYIGPLENITKELRFGMVQPYYKKEICSIFDRYNYILNNWAGYKDDDELDYDDFEDELDDDDFDFEDSDNEDDVVLEVTQPLVRSEPKIGRNDPCSCGSGKKYKKCHGK